MDSRRWQRVVELYERAAEHETATRRSFLQEACEGDNELCREVQSLLDQNVTEPGLLEKVAAWTAAPPVSIGSYRIGKLIGEGGMGAVYEAEQENPRRTVALKVVKYGLAEPDVLRRFEQESQALARLQHPGIAQIYEAGVAGGRPYFAMERIHGLGLMEYAVAQRLGISQRIELMIRICESVEHAHRRGIIHRDLKPGNILVDESGQPKVLDFGVARITDADARVTRGTDVGKVIGTLAYMSPEQVAGDAAELDARSDVYALGVILYELLAGQAPYETGRNLPEAVRVIREQEPIALERVVRECRGDLATIVSKAMEKDKARRYATAADLAAELRRHLADQPILARPASTLYVMRKLVQRHKAIAGALLAIFVVLSGGVLVSMRQAARARRAEQTARAVSDFLQNDLLSQASPETQAGPQSRPDPDLKVRTALDRAAASIGGRFAAQPEVEAAIRQTIGTTYSQLALYKEAQQQMEHALELRRRVLGTQDTETQSSMQELGELYLVAGKPAQAETLLAPLLEIRRRKFGLYNADTLRTMNDLSGVMSWRGDYENMARLQEQVLEGTRRVLGPEHPHTLIAISNLGSSYSSIGKFAESVGLYRQAVEIKKRVMGTEHPSTMSSMNGLAVALRKQGKYDEAESLMNQVVELRRRVLGPTHHDALLAVYHLGLVYMAESRYTDAERVFTEGLDTSRRVLPDHPDTQNFVAGLAEVDWKLGKTAQAEAMFREAVANRRRVSGPAHRETAGVLATWGEMKLDQKNYADAEPLLREALSIYEKVSPTDWRRHHTQAMLGEALAGVGRTGEAAPLLAGACDALVQKKAAIPAERRPVVDAVLYWKSQVH